MNYDEKLNVTNRKIKANGNQKLCKWSMYKINRGFKTVFGKFGNNTTSHIIITLNFIPSIVYFSIGFRIIRIENTKNSKKSLLTIYLVKNTIHKVIDVGFGGSARHLDWIRSSQE